MINKSPSLLREGSGSVRDVREGREGSEGEGGEPQHQYSAQVTMVVLHHLLQCTHQPPRLRVNLTRGANGPRS